MSGNKLFSVKYDGPYKIINILGLKIKKKDLIQQQNLIIEQLKHIASIVEYNLKKTPFVYFWHNAYQESIEYIKNNMDFSKLMIFDGRLSNLSYALKNVTNDGLYLEFGVYKAQTTNHIAKNINKTIYGFDSFVGLPDNWTGHQTEAGGFDLKGILPPVKENVVLVNGWFKDTLPGFLQKHKENIAFMHIDCDIYSSTRDVFELCADRIKAGTIIVFDEYFNYPNWQNHEYKAFQEFVQKYNVKYEYLSVAVQQVSVKIISIDN